MNWYIMPLVLCPVWSFVVFFSLSFVLCLRHSDSQRYGNGTFRFFIFFLFFCSVGSVVVMVPIPVILFNWHLKRLGYPKLKFWENRLRFEWTKKEAWWDDTLCVLERAMNGTIDSPTWRDIYRWYTGTYLIYLVYFYLLDFSYAKKITFSGYYLNHRIIPDVVGCAGASSSMNLSWRQRMAMGVLSWDLCLKQFHLYGWREEKKRKTVNRGEKKGLPFTGVMRWMRKFKIERSIVAVAMYFEATASYGNEAYIHGNILYKCICDQVARQNRHSGVSECCFVYIGSRIDIFEAFEVFK